MFLDFSYESDYYKGSAGQVWLWSEMGLVMFELFLAEPHLKLSITSLKVEQYIIQTIFFRFGFCEKKEL